MGANTIVARIAVGEPGRGDGPALLERVVSKIFAATPAHRLWRGVSPDILRTRCRYESVGFRTEDVARGNRGFGGVHRDEPIMAILRTDRPAVARPQE